ncbi:MAG: hypothetical protein P4L84_04985 [Isosphaeraceae bacterium]|nr:hypothetical protein [Isosphaeraceae bacterium]
MARLRKLIAKNSRVASALAMAWVMAILTVLPGCGGSTPAPEELKGLHPVKGTVKSEVGSVAGMMIYFFPNSGDAKSSSGEVKADGSFELHTRIPGDGASDGEFKVYFSKPLGGAKTGSSFPAKFLSPDTTDVKATIKPDTTDLGTITLKR